MGFLNDKKGLPHLGVGLGLRREIFAETVNNRDQLDWVEIIPENYMGRGGKALEMLEQAQSAQFPIISHGVNLSIGSTDPLSEDYLTELQSLFQRVQPAWFSDHLCFTSIEQVYFNDLLPLPFTWEAVEHVVKRIKTIQARFDAPFLIENISYYAHFAPSELTEAQFLSEILEQADCGLLLDVNNVYVNAQNHGYNPVSFIEALPLERVVQLHMAGHLKKPNLIIDTHGAPICEDVWDLLAEVLRRVSPHGILLERDSDIPPIESLLAEIQQIRTIQHQAQALGKVKVGAV